MKINHLYLLSGGERGIRTPGTVIPYGSLANCWFQPLTHLTLTEIVLSGNVFLHTDLANRTTKLSQILISAK